MALIEHELGHSLGLGHDTCSNGLMNATVASGRVLTAEECAIIDQANHPHGEPPDGCQDISCEYSPIVIDLSGSGYRLTGFEDPVTFDINNNGAPDTIGWTAPNSEIGFLWIDLNGDGTVNSGAELFGTARGARNGFEVLRRYDQFADGDVYYGGNEDGVIDSQDAVWPYLKIWVDRNHDGISQASEVVSLASAGVMAISLQYRATSKHDRFGNEFRFQGSILRRQPGGRIAREQIYDVIFVGSPSP